MEPSAGIEHDTMALGARVLFVSVPRVEDDSARRETPPCLLNFPGPVSFLAPVWVCGHLSLPSLAPFRRTGVAYPPRFRRRADMVRLVEGQIVEDDEGGGVTWAGLCRLLRCQGTINFLGFRVPMYWSCVAAIFACLKFGAAGLVFVGVVAGEAAEDEEAGQISRFSLVLLGFRCKTFLLALN